ncbi:MAG: nuclear transport factor 2 family protein [Sphingomicrobium sp.]
MTTSAENKRINAEVFDGLAKADPTAFVDSMADDIVWIIEGQSRLSRRYEGKDALRNELIPALFANFATDYRNYADEIIAEGDRVVVLARGEVKTVRGEDYNNSYCFVFRMRGGKIVEVREYCDTAGRSAVADGIGAGEADGACLGVGSERQPELLNAE